MKRKNKELEEKILYALFRYYFEDITFERAAEDAGIPIYDLIKYVNDNYLPMIQTEKDVSDGLRKVVQLMDKRGFKSPLRI